MSLRNLVSSSGCIRGAMVALALLSLTTSLGAQTFGAATIHGHVADETGGALPGVAVSGRSPALQLSAVTVVTDGNGDYQLKSLPPGTYEVRYELAGFQSVVRQDITLNAGFDAKIDITLKVGAMEETVTVSGQSPVIDVTSTRVSANLTRETLDVIPTSKSLAESIAMAPGVRYSGAIDVGGNRTASFGDGGTNFGSSQQSPFLEGVNVRLFEGGSQAYMDQRSLEEIQVNAVGNDAEVGPPGIAWNGVIRSGGNQFHGLGSAEGQRPELQSNNIDADLRAKGIDPAGNGINYYWDFSGSLGGRIVKDKVWFFTAERNIRRAANVIGFAKAPGPDNKYGTPDDILGEGKIDNTDQTLKMSYQMGSHYRVIGFIQRSLKHEFTRNAGPLFPLESTWDYFYPPKPHKIEFEATFGKGLLFNALYGRSFYKALWRPQSEDASRPITQDIATGIQTGSAISAYNPNSNPIITSSLSWYPQHDVFGRHELKVGFQEQIQHYGAGNPNRANGNFILVFDGGKPYQFISEDRPVDAGATLHNPAMYVKDTWRVGRVTANLGVRWEKYHGFTDDSTKVQGTFGSAYQYSGIDVVDWNSVAPRLGVAWDVRGSGKTVVKAQWGRFNHESSASYALGFATDTLNVITYKWHDLNADNLYQPGEVNLDLNSGDYVSASRRAGATTAPANQIVNPDLKQPHTTETSLALEQELAAGVSLRGLLVYKRVNSQFSAVNVLRPYSAWDIPVSRNDPGPDGAYGTADDRGPVQLYDFEPAYAGNSFVGNRNTNRDSAHDDSYKGYELTVTKRSDRRWSLTGSFQQVKNHVWTNAGALPSGPNDLFFPLDETWDWSGKLLASYLAPQHIQVSALYNFLRGTPQQRTYQFRTAGPAGTKPLTQVGNVTIPLEPLGASRNAPQRVLNLRAARGFRLAHSQDVTLSFQLFNALNANSATTVRYVSGPTFGQISASTPPRVARLGIEYKF
jgi:hypothetical protein